MAVVEDAATVLEDFIQDVANLPAEMAHLLEEIQAKDKCVQDCRNTIASRDNSLQKFIRTNGSLAVHPKEELYAKTIGANYEQAQVLQEEKVLVSEKAAVILDRHIRRLDYKIRDLTRQGVMPKDPPMPSILASSMTDGPFSSDQANTPNTGASTPLNALSTNGLPGTTIANSSITRLAHPGIQSQRTGSPSIMGGQSLMTSSAPTTPAASAALHLHHQRHHRESSTGAINDVANKRRRLNAHLGSLPSTSSALARGSSLGPGTPKAGTPGASGFRAGSAGPRAGGNKKAMSGAAAANRKLAPHQQIRKKAGGGGGRLSLQHPANRRLAGTKKQNGGGGAGGMKPSPSDEDSILSDDIMTPPSGEEALTPRSHGHAHSGHHLGITSSGGHGAADGGRASKHPHALSHSTSSAQQGQRAGRKSSSQAHVRADGASSDDGEGASEEEDEEDEERDDDDEDDGAEDGDGLDEAEEHDADEDDDEAVDADADADDRRYCTCRSVSYGNMVACDNEKCPYEWFHWQCVGMTKEPIGKWYCGECSVKLGIERKG